MCCFINSKKEKSSFIFTEVLFRTCTFLLLLEERGWIPFSFYQCIYFTQLSVQSLLWILLPPPALGSSIRTQVKNAQHAFLRSSLLNLNKLPCDPVAKRVSGKGPKITSSSSPASPAAAGGSPAELGVPGRRSRRWAAPGSSRNRSTSETGKRGSMQLSPPVAETKARQESNRKPDCKCAISETKGLRGQVASGPRPKADRGKAVTRHVMSWL